MSAEKLMGFINESKEKMKPIAVDLKDAKRRVSAAKGPKKKKAKAGSEPEESGGESDGSN